MIDPTTGAPRKFAYAPSLVVVDGGPPQVAAAARALDELGISDVALCGLAKRLEEVWLPDSDDPVILPRTSEGLYLLQRLRDEAHRFAITHHRERRSKSMVESVLDQVPGLGEVRRKLLLNHFGSLKKLRAAYRRGDRRCPWLRHEDRDQYQASVGGSAATRIDQHRNGRNHRGLAPPLPKCSRDNHLRD